MRIGPAKNLMLKIIEIWEGSLIIVKSLMNSLENNLLLIVLINIYPVTNTTFNIDIVSMKMDTWPVNTFKAEHARWVSNG